MLWIEGHLGTSAIPGLPTDHAIHAAMWAGKIASRGRKTTVGDVLTPLLSELAAAADASSVAAVTDALTELKALELRHTSGDVGLWPTLPTPAQTWPKTLTALQDPAARFLLELLCGDLPVDQWQAKELMARAVWPALSRAPVGNRLDLQYS